MKIKLAVVASLVLAGTNIFTYATTRYLVTDHVVGTAEESARSWLVQEEFMHNLADPAGAAVEIPAERQRAGKRLWGDILLAGGMYRWWNDALPHWGLGLFLLAVGVLLPFYRRVNVAGVCPECGKGIEPPATRSD